MKQGVSLVTIMKKIIIIVVVLSLCLMGCEAASAPSKLTFEEWKAQELVYPDWAEAKEYTLEADNPYGPTSTRMSYTLEEAQNGFKEMRYLVENHSYSDAFPFYNMWKYYMSNDALQLGAPLVAYKISESFYNMPEGTEVIKYERKGKTTVYTIDDNGYRETAKLNMFKAMVMAGYQEEAFAFYQTEKLDQVHSGFISLAWTLHNAGQVEEAKKVLAKSIVIENLDDHPWQIASNVLGAVAYYYVNGDYDQAIATADIVLSEGIDSTNEAIFMGRDRTEGYFNNHWTSCFTLIERYKALAESAKNGDVVDFTKLHDGSYKATNTGYILTPIEVTIAIEEGNLASFESAQETLPKDDRSATATEAIPQRIMQEKSIAVDVMSSATITSESVRLSMIEALLEAMSK